MRVYLGNINEYKSNSKDITKKIKESDIKSMRTDELFNNLMNGSIDVNYVFKLGSDKGHSILSYYCQNEYNVEFIFKLLKNFPHININHKFDGKTTCFNLLLNHYSFLERHQGLDLAELFLEFPIDKMEIERLLHCLLFINLNSMTHSNFNFDKYIELIKKIINKFNIDINTKLYTSNETAWEAICYLIRTVVGKYTYRTEVTGYIDELVNFFLSKNPKIEEKNFIELFNGNKVMYEFLKLLMDNKK